MIERDITISNIKSSILALCREKGWGDNGFQNPQHMAMAMTVEAGELLECFNWREDVKLNIEEIGFELADTLIYGLQIMTELKIDVAGSVERKLSIVAGRPDAIEWLEENASDERTTIRRLRERQMELIRKKGWSGDARETAISVCVETTEMLEHFQWLEPEAVRRLLNGQDGARTRLIAEEFADVFIYSLQLSTALELDIADLIMRKLEIVRNRKPKMREV